MFKLEGIRLLSNGHATYMPIRVSEFKELGVKVGDIMEVRIRSDRTGEWYVLYSRIAQQGHSYRLTIPEIIIDLLDIRPQDITSAQIRLEKSFKKETEV